jgi:hypothetical protein
MEHEPPSNIRPLGTQMSGEVLKRVMRTQGIAFWVEVGRLIDAHEYFYPQAGTPDPVIAWAQLKHMAISGSDGE